MEIRPHSLVDRKAGFEAEGGLQEKLFQNKTVSTVQLSATPKSAQRIHTSVSRFLHQRHLTWSQLNRNQSQRLSQHALLFVFLHSSQLLNLRVCNHNCKDDCSPKHQHEHCPKQPHTHDLSLKTKIKRPVSEREAIARGHHKTPPLTGGKCR